MNNTIKLSDLPAQISWLGLARTRGGGGVRKKIPTPAKVEAGVGRGRRFQALA